MLLEVIAAAIIFGLISGGRLPRLNDLELRGATLIFIALLVQLTLPAIGRLEAKAAPVVLIGSFVLLVAALLSNKKTPAVLLMTVGVSLNLLVIAINGGMPVATSALSAAADDLIHIPISDTTRLPWLGDVIRWPLPGALNGLVSLGDFFLSAGVFLIIYVGMLYKGRRRKRGDHAGQPDL